MYLVSKPEPTEGQKTAKGIMRCPWAKSQGTHLHSSHLCFSQETQPHPNQYLYPLLPNPRAFSLEFAH